MKKIGMVGLGVMGHAMAQNMMKNGVELVLYDLRPELYTDLIEQGAEGAESLEDLGSRVETVMMIVNAYPHCVSVLSGLLKTMNGGVIINSSTITVEDARNLEKMAAEKGVRMMDVPVSGGSRGAADGSLTIMASGANDLFETYKPFFETFGKKIIHVGPNCGDGQAMKAVNQLLVGVHMCATAEAFTMARQCGLDLNMVYDTITSSAGNSRIFENRGQFLIDRDFTKRSTLATQLKDTDIACKTARAVGTPCFLANTAAELFKLACNKYPNDDDSLEVVRLYEELSGLKLD